MIERVAYLSVHTSPLARPGLGDAGGMNVYIDELAKAMAARGVAVDVFTQRTAPDEPEVVEAVPGYRVIHIDTGEAAPTPVGDLNGHVEEFADGVVRWISDSALSYDIVHSHYWLSGWAGLLVKRRLGIPLANSFHTLGRVKDAARREDEAPESLLRIATEHDVIAGADCVIASTPSEAEDLLDRYGADPTKLCISPPGVDHNCFSPGDQQEARARVGLPAEAPVLLFVGRIQPLKGVDVAIGAVAKLVEEWPETVLLVVGGPSGPMGDAELERLQTRTEMMGLSGNVRFVGRQRHTETTHYYRAADVLMVPSRSESFGLVAVEAQACALPVVAARVGGLAHAVTDGESGFLVDGWDEADYAAVVAEILRDSELHLRLRKGAVEHADSFSWELATSRFLELYDGIR